MANIYFWQDFNNYFAAGADTKPLLHLWTLSVEEQFYIVYPVVLSIFRHRSRRQIVSLLTLIMLASLGFSIWASINRPAVAFYFTTSRAWELLLGSVLAIRAWRSPGVLMCDIATAVGLVLIGVSVVALSSELRFPGINALYPCLGTALVLYAGQDLRIARVLLCSGPVVWIGQISYSLYLFHWPALVLAKYYLLRELMTSEKISLIVLTLVLASLSLMFVERPLRRPGTIVHRPVLFASAGACTCLFIALGTLGILSSGWPGRFPGYMAPDTNATTAEYREGTCFVPRGVEAGSWNEAECRLSWNHKDRVILWGDSYAAHLVPGFLRSAKEVDFDVLQLTAAACLPLIYPSATDRCSSFSHQALDIIQKGQPSGVILAGRWVYYPEAAKYLGSTIDAIVSHGVKVLVMGQTAQFSFPNPYDLLYREGRLGHKGNYHSLLSVKEKFNDEMRDASGQAYFIDPLPLMCTREICDIQQAGHLLYIDSGHLSLEGSEALVRSIATPLNRYFTPLLSQR